MGTREVQAIRTEIESVRLALQALNLRLEDLEESLQRLEGEEEEIRSGGPSRGPASSRAGASFAASVVSEGTAWTSLTSRAIAVEDQEGRLELAKQIGLFLRRANSGKNRGTSGRDRLRLQSRYYVVVRNFEGSEFQPPLFFDRFAPVRDHCKRGPNTGSSCVFVGFPTQWEARVALVEAGFQLPPALTKGRLLQSLLVDADGGPREHYDLCHLSVAREGSEEEVFELIPIVVSDKRILVAAPEVSWSTTPKERRLGTRTLVRPMRVEVVAAYLSAPSEPLDDKEAVVWVGLLDQRYAKRLVKGQAPHAPAASVWRIEDGDARVEERTLIPFGPALKDILEEHFVFQTAPSGEQSGGGGLEGKPVVAAAASKEKKEVDVEERLKKMEEMIQRMATQFAAAQPAMSRGEAGGSAAVPAYVEPAPKRKSALKNPEKDEASQLEGLDPTVVAAAVEAGVPIEQLKHLGSLLRKTTRMQDVATSQICSQSQRTRTRMQRKKRRRRSQMEKEAKLPKQL